ncbi:MAG: imidazole glycerol phosphate synthase subunit HisH [Bacteroidota bacterium]
MIAIVDYGMGNLRNVLRACHSVGAEAFVTSGAAEIASADSVILPGVGAFGEAVKRIDALGMREPLIAHWRRGKTLLGICLGLQLLFDRSEESPGAQGLGMLAGQVSKLAAGLKIPHIGWNDVAVTNENPLIGTGGIFYFVHSYVADVSPATVAVTEYGRPFSAAVMQRNLFGVQFHPEKSQNAGLEILRRFTVMSNGYSPGGV